MSVYETTNEWETPELEFGETAGEFGETGEFAETGEFGEMNEYGETESEGFLGGLLGSVLGGEVGEIGEAEGPLSEAQEVAVANELLEVTSEAELEQFLGGLVNKVAKGVGGFMRSNTGKALGGILKNVARKALPIAGGALGSFIAPGVGTAIGSKLGTMASKMFEMEFEGMSSEQAEFEVARRYVRLASTAAAHAARAPRSAPPQAVARAAFVTAAKKHAPGILRGTPYQTNGRPSRPTGGGQARRAPGRTRPRRRPRGGGYGGGYAYGGPTYVDGGEPYAGVADPGWGDTDGGDGGFGYDADDGYDSPRRRTRAQSGRWVRRGHKIVILGS